MEAVETTSEISADERVADVAYVELETDDDSESRLHAGLAEEEQPANSEGFSWKSMLESFGVVAVIAVWWGALLLLALSLGASTPAPKPLDAPAFEFSEARAQNVLSHLWSQAPIRLCGSDSAVVRQALLELLQGFTAAANTTGGWTVQVDAPSLSGVAVATDEEGRAVPSFYSNATSILARLSPTASWDATSDLPVIAVVTHIDAVAAGIGASQDVAPMAVLLELIRALVHYDTADIRHGIVFVFSDCHYVPHQPALAAVRRHPWLQKIGALLLMDGLGVRYDESVRRGLVFGTHTKGPWQLIDAVAAAALRRPAIPLKISTFRQESSSDALESFGWAPLQILNPESTIPSLGFEGISGRRFQGTSRDSSPAAVIPGAMQHIGDLFLRTLVSASWESTLRTSAFVEPSLSLSVVDIVSRSVVALTRPGLMGLCIPLALTYAASTFLFVWKVEEKNRIRAGVTMLGYIKPYAIGLVFPVFPAFATILLTPLLVQLLTFFNSLVYYRWLHLAAFHWALWGVVFVCLLLVGAQRFTFAREVMSASSLIVSTTALWNAMLLVIWWMPGPVSLYFILFFNALMADLGLLVRFGLSQLLLQLRPNLAKHTPRHIHAALDGVWLLVASCFPVFAAFAVGIPGLALIQDIGLTNVRAICLPYGLIFVIIGLNAVPILGHVRHKLWVALSVLGVAFIFYVAVSAVPTYSTTHPKLLDVRYVANVSGAAIAKSDSYFVMSSKDYLGIDTRLPPLLNDTSFSCEVPQQCFIDASPPVGPLLGIGNLSVFVDTAAQKTYASFPISSQGCIYVDLDIIDEKQVDGSTANTFLSRATVNGAAFDWPKSSKADRRRFSFVCTDRGDATVALALDTLAVPWDSLRLTVSAHYQVTEGSRLLIQDIERKQESIQVVYSDYSSEQVFTSKLGALRLSRKR